MSLQSEEQIEICKRKWLKKAASWSRQPDGGEAGEAAHVRGERGLRGGHQAGGRAQEEGEPAW